MVIDKIKQKDLSIEILRAFAIIFVLVIHVAAKFTIMKYGTTTVIYAFIDAFSNVAVPLFVFISGYVLGKRYMAKIPYLPYFKKRVLRILPPYIIASIFYLVFYAVLNKGGLTLNLPRLFRALIHADASYHLWFIRLVVVLYLIFPLINKLLKGEKAIYFLILSLLLQIVWLFNGAVLTNWLIIFSHIFFFCLGIYFSNHEIFGWIKKMNGKVQSFLIVFLATLMTYFWIKGVLIYGFFYSIPQEYSLKTLLVSLFLYSQTIITLFYFREKIFNKLGYLLRKILLNIGKYSFEIYLIHLAYQILVVKYLYADSDFSNPTFLPISVLLTLLLSYFSVILIYRTITLTKRLFLPKNSIVNKPIS